MTLQLTKAQLQLTLVQLFAKIWTDCEPMNRIVSTLLIPLLLMSQSLFSAPHTHAGSSIVEPNGHAARPHVHLHDANHRHDHHSHRHGHHEDGDDVPSSTGEQDSDHDSDAVYVGDDSFLHDGKVVRAIDAELAAVYVVGEVSPAKTSLFGLCHLHSSSVKQRPKCALYLQLLSIRC